MPWQEDSSQKAVGSNLGAGNVFFHKITVKVNLYDHLIMDFVRYIISVSTVSWMYVAGVPRIQIKEFF